MNVYTFCDFNTGVPQDFTDFIYRDAFPYQFCRKSVPQGVAAKLFHPFFPAYSSTEPRRSFWSRVALRYL